MKSTKSKVDSKELYIVETGRFALRPRQGMKKYEVEVIKKRGKKQTS